MNIFFVKAMKKIDRICEKMGNNSVISYTHTLPNSNPNPNTNP